MPITVDRCECLAAPSRGKQLETQATVEEHGYYYTAVNVFLSFSCHVLSDHSNSKPLHAFFIYMRRIEERLAIRM